MEQKVAAAVIQDLINSACMFFLVDKKILVNAFVEVEKINSTPKAQTAHLYAENFFIPFIQKIRADYGEEFEKFLEKFASLAKEALKEWMSNVRKAI